MEGIEIQLWEEEKLTRWREILPVWQNFWASEPMNSAGLGADPNENMQSKANLVRDRILNSELPIVVAWDTAKQKVIGFACLAVQYSDAVKQKHPELATKNMYDFTKYGFDKKTLKRMEGVTAFKRIQANKADIFNRYKVDRVCAAVAGGILPEYRGCGLSSIMLDRVIEVAEEKGFTLFIYSASNSIIQGHAKRRQHEKVLELSYAEFYPNYSEMPEEVRSVHKSAVVYAKHLSPRVKSKL